MPRPSSGWAIRHSTGLLSGMTDKDVLWATAEPRHFNAAFFEAQTLGLTTDSGVLEAIAKNIHWHRFGTSYIVDELIGGPWDD